jgi:flavin reductase (DIM6/NTAB) family NADH-FMN oxidoreductase RutF
MPILQKVHKAINRIVFGDTLIPQEFTVGMTEPQMEITVWLHGMGVPIDVTRRNTTACCAPLIIGVSLDKEQWTGEQTRRLALQYCERAGQKRTLGEIRLAPRTVISLDGSELVLFNVRGSTNYCLPRHRLWAHFLTQAYSNWRNLSSFDVKMTAQEMRAAIVTFIRPHPLMLGSIGSEAKGNIFPMNLMGELGNGYFAFALKDSRRAAHLVEDAGRIALSNVPLPLCSTAFQLAINHKKDAIAWEQLPFGLKLSKEFRIPVPVQAPRVRELQLEQVRRIGSHTLLISRIISDETFSHDLEVHMIHGFYQHWRLRGQGEQLRASLVEDALNKRGLAPS